jgi:mono/diheme cytochrome c family protein
MTANGPRSIEPLTAGRLSWTLPCLLALGACGHTGSAKQRDPGPSAERADSGDARPVQPRAQPEERIEDFMVDHFILVTFSRDAVINGELEALREPLSALAEHDYATVAPGGWMPWIAQIQQAAGLTAEAGSLEVAASGVATMARSCGGCHRESGGGPQLDESIGSEAGAPPSDTLDARMRRHMWAADRMWEGLTAPSDRAWQDGAAALAHTPSAPPATDPPLPPQFVAALAEMRGLADAASEATAPAQRADVYANYLASCAGCHKYGVELDF